MLFSRSLLATVPFIVSISARPQFDGGASNSVVNSTTCNGKTYVYNELAGYGFIANNARDKFGDTIGGIGSSIAIDKLSWVRLPNNVYTGLLYALPDRGWNTEGTLNYQNRIQKFLITFTPNASATVANPSPPNIQFKYLDTILLTDPAGSPAVGLDGGLSGPYLTFPGYSFEFPSANYTGDGFGGAGEGGYRLVIDAEGLVLGNDATFWVSDEYGDFVYNFNQAGRMIGAIRPPDAFIPQRNGAQSFSSDNAPRYNPALRPTPRNPVTGRANNQGLEGLSTNPLGTKLYALAQSALRQDSGSGNPTTRNARLLVYDISGLNRRSPRLEAEYVVPLSNVMPGNPASNIARQSEIHYISDTQFLILARDSGAGRGQGASTTSIYRHVDVFDISRATNIAGKSDATASSIAPGGVLLANTTASQYCSWLDYNVNSQLNRFGVRNGGAQSDGLLNEKWESLAVVPVNPALGGLDGNYYILSFSDNDFITQDGYLKGGEFRYSDSTGYSLDNQALLFRVQLPRGSFPLLG
ncbi:Putative Phytase-like domain-containing protein [Septoria linicola]|uniref:Phytase-like domain-containing protein n=1 Tax=Septoria linicola TaxID=215465 RepID=A0A9Q9AKT1_9PEZI|nr:Putative Phytase-like domain-containing protein [Septoria linicola]